MSKTCGLCESSYDIVGVDEHNDLKDNESVYRECLRPRYHHGPHMIKRLERVGGKYVIFQTDFCSEAEEDCYCCQSEDTDDWCQIYREISEKEAYKYINDSKCVEEGWDA